MERVSRAPHYIVTLPRSLIIAVKRLLSAGIEVLAAIISGIDKQEIPLK